MSTIETVIPKRQSLLRASTLVSFMTFLSRMTGFARDMILAHLFGAQAGMDAFIIAFRIPNFMRRLFAEGAFSQAFVPVLAEYQQTQSHENVQTFIARVAGQLSTVLTLVTLIGVIAAPVIIFIFAPGFGEHSPRALLATEMLRLTFPYLMMVSLTAMAGAVLNTYGHFAVPAITPVFLNLMLILSAFFLTPFFSPPIVGLAWGVFIAGIIQFLFQLPFLHRRHLLIRPRRAHGDEGVRRVMRLMIPALFGVSIAQLNLIIDSIFASFLKVGSVSWLYYTDRLTDFPLGVFGVAIATVILPHLSRRHAEKNAEHFSYALDWGLRMILLIGVPASIGLIFFSMPIIACCFAYGKFTSFDLIQTQKSLIALAFGIPAFMMVKVLASGFYAKQNIRTPVKVGAIAMVVNSLLCALFIWPLAHAGLALASALSGYVNSGVLLFILKKRAIYHPKSGWPIFILQLCLANLMIAVYLYLMSGTIDDWLTLTPLIRLGKLFIHVSTTILMYLAILYISGTRISQFRSFYKE